MRSSTCSRSLVRLWCMGSRCWDWPNIWKAFILTRDVPWEAGRHDAQPDFKTTETPYPAVDAVLHHDFAAIDHDTSLALPFDKWVIEALKPYDIELHLDFVADFYVVRISTGSSSVSGRGGRPRPPNRSPR